MQRFYSGYTDPHTPRLAYRAPPSLPVSTRSIYDAMQRDGLWAASDDEWAKRAKYSFHSSRKAQPVVGGYGFKAYVFCNAELRRILSRREWIRRIPSPYLIHLPGTAVPLDGKPISTSRW